MLVRYTIHYVDEETYEDKTREGISFGTSYADAAKRIVKWYGEKNVYRFEIELMEEILDGYDLKAIVDEIKHFEA